MRGGLRLPALVVVIGLLAGCSDPAGAVRRERAAARKSSPSPRPSAPVTPKKPHHRTVAWSQAPARTKTSGGLRVRTGALRSGRIRIVVTDLRDHVSRTLTVTALPHAATVGRFTLTGIKVVKSPQTGAYGIGFHYRSR
jgi:hypothetical protein